MQGQWAREPAAALSAKSRRRLNVFAPVYRANIWTRQARLAGSSVHSPRLLHGVMHVARPSASVSSRSSVGAVSREPVQGVALLCPPAVARPSLRPPSVRVRRKDAAVVTVATQCLKTLS